MAKFEEKRMSAIIMKDGKWFTSYSPETGVASQGRTRDSAIKNLKEAVELYFEDDDVVLPQKTEVAQFKAKVRAHA